MTDANPDIRTLDALRRQIDALDDRLQDLLIERARIVAEVSSLKRSDKVPPFRPGREAEILRRLVGRHQGPFPRAALVRIWREILGGSIAMQTELSVALGPGCGELARDHFGSGAPILEFPSAAEVILAVREGGASVGVLPLSDETEPWWQDLADLPAGVRPRIIARLPFGTCGSDAPVQDAFVIALMEPEASGDDCSLFAISAAEPLSTARITDAFLEAGLDSAPAAEAQRDGGSAVLVAVEAMLGADDPRVLRALEPLGHGLTAVWLGAYARPLPDTALDVRLPA